MLILKDISFKNLLNLYSKNNIDKNIGLNYFYRNNKVKDIYLNRNVPSNGELKLSYLENSLYDISEIKITNYDIEDNICKKTLIQLLREQNEYIIENTFLHIIIENDVLINSTDINNLHHGLKLNLLELNYINKIEFKNYGRIECVGDKNKIIGYSTVKIENIHTIDIYIINNNIFKTIIGNILLLEINKNINLKYISDNLQGKIGIENETISNFNILNGTIELYPFFNKIIDNITKENGWKHVKHLNNNSKIWYEGNATEDTLIRGDYYEITNLYKLNESWSVNYESIEYNEMLFCKGKINNEDNINLEPEYWLRTKKIREGTKRIYNGEWGEGKGWIILDKIDSINNIEKYWYYNELSNADNIINEGPIIVLSKSENSYINNEDLYNNPITNGVILYQEKKIAGGYDIENKIHGGIRDDVYYDVLIRNSKNNIKEKEKLSLVDIINYLPNFINLFENNSLNSYNCILTHDLYLNKLNDQSIYIFKIDKEITVNLLLIGGGGGGGGGSWDSHIKESNDYIIGGGGGGAGGLIFKKNIILKKGEYKIKIGRGGFGAESGWGENIEKGENGKDTSIEMEDSTIYIAYGGGGGGSRSKYNNIGNDGGSGGGSVLSYDKTILFTSGGKSISNQGNNGGDIYNFEPYTSGGGGYYNKGNDLLFDNNNNGNGGNGINKIIIENITYDFSYLFGTTEYLLYNNIYLFGELYNNNIYFSGGGGSGGLYDNEIIGGIGGGGNGKRTNISINNYNYNQKNNKSENGQEFTGGGGGGGMAGHGNYIQKEAIEQLEYRTGNGGNGGSGILIINYSSIKPLIGFGNY